MALASCQKTVTLKDVTKENNTETQALSERYGASVVEGTLKFESSEKYLELLNMDQSEKEAFFDLLNKIPNFTSRNELENTSSNSKTANDCNCFIDDEYTNSILNSNYMVVINNFLIKLDGCNNKVYVSDELAANSNERKNAFLACDFNRSDIWVYTFDHAVEDELPILRDSINGNPNARIQIGCKEVAVGRRYASAAQAQGVPPWGYVTTPAFEIEYNNWGLSGTLRARSINNTGVTTFTAWQFDFQPEHYKRRCSSTTNMTHVVNGSNTSYGKQYLCHSGTRLTNVGMVKLRMKRVSNEFSAWIQIVF